MGDRYGLDVSNNQRSIDFSAVPPQDFWYHKASEGQGFTDPYLRGPTENREAAFVSRGEPFGVYHFTHCGWGRVDDEVSRFVDSGAADGQLRPVYDLEATILDPPSTARWAATFCDDLANRINVAPIIYTGAWFMAPRNGGWCAPDPTLARFDLWLSAYPLGYTPTYNAPKVGSRVPAPWTEYLFWQFTSSAPVAGISGGVDRSVIAEANWARLFKTQPPQPIPDPVEDKVLTLIRAPNGWIGVTDGVHKHHLADGNDINQTLFEYRRSGLTVKADAGDKAYEWPQELVDRIADA